MVLKNFTTNDLRARKDHQVVVVVRPGEFVEPLPQLEGVELEPVGPARATSGEMTVARLRNVSSM